MSVINVTNAPIVLIGKNISRDKVILQNTGSEDVFVKKWFYGNPIAPIPSATNYDFILTAKPGEGKSQADIYQIASVSAFVGVTASNKCSTVGASETVKVGV